MQLRQILGNRGIEFAGGSGVPTGAGGTAQDSKGNTAEAEAWYAGLELRSFPNSSEPLSVSVWQATADTLSGVNVMLSKGLPTVVSGRTCPFHFPPAAVLSQWTWRRCVCSWPWASLPAFLPSNVVFKSQRLIPSRVFSGFHAPCPPSPLTCDTRPYYSKNQSLAHKGHTRHTAHN